METLHLLFLIFLFAIHIPSKSATYIPDINIAVDCGFSGVRNSPDGREWTGDITSKFSPSDNGKSTAATAPGNAVNDKLFNTVRLSRSNFTYTFPVTPGPKFIRLFFFPTTYDGFPRFDSFFTVKTGQFTLLRNFSAAFTADFSRQQFLSKEFSIDVGTNQKLDISFTPSPNSYAFVNGIEIISMPSNLYYYSPKLETVALESYHRINVGGEEVQAGEDSGLFRRWAVNEWYIDSASGFVIKIDNYSFPINYTSATPDYIAPDPVYQSSISMGKNQTYNGLRNLSWNLPVHVGFDYLLRLHFCQFETFVFDKNENKRNFTVFVNKKKMENGTVDLESLGFPVFKDFIVTADDRTSNISIDLDPLPSVSNDAILNGIEVFKLSNNSNLAVPNPPGPPTSPPLGVTRSVKKSNEMVIIAAVCSSVGFAVLFSVVGFIVLWKLSKRKTKKKKKKTRTTMTGGPLLPEQRCQSFTFEEILEATDYFNKEREIGVGGFGAVYKGIFDDDIDGIGTVTAIKRLNPDSQQGEQEFKNEIELLSDLRHYHLVRLIGYCIQGKERLLVYEFMENGTLKDHLYDTTNPPLPWTKRLQICYEAASGLNYLHMGVDGTIIHRDVKTTNILLDKNFIAKVSDFGMSKMGPSNTAISTAVKGTWAYLDPEYYRRFQVTEKSDVYSFGVVLFEVLCGRKPLDSSLGAEQFKLILWAQKCIEKGTIHQIIDINLKGKISPECLKQFLELATSCISDQMKDRPTMAEVEEKLRFILQLQEEADAKEKEKNPDGDFSYPEEALSLMPSMVASMRSDSYKSHVANVMSGSDYTASTVMSEDPFPSNNGGSDWPDSTKKSID